MTIFFVFLLALAPADKQARDLHEQAKRAYNVGKYSDAERLFSECYLASGSPEFLYNGAQAARQGGHAVEAVRLYKAFLREKPSAPNRERIEMRIKELASSKPVAPAPADSRDLSDPFESPPVVRTAPAPPPPPPPPRGLPRWAPWVAAGATAVLATGAIVAGLSAGSRYDNLAMTCGKTPAGCTDAQIDGVKSRALAANVLWGLTAVGAVGTGVTFYFREGGAGVVIGGKF